MISKITKTIAIVAICLFGFVALNPTPVFAVKNNAVNNIVDPCNTITDPAVKAAAGCENSNITKDTLSNNVINILNGVIAILGVIAVIFIVIGGVNFMTSTGDAGKIKKAKDTILYAVIGLVICVLSFAIVNFVIINILKANGVPEGYQNIGKMTSDDCAKLATTYNTNTHYHDGNCYVKP